MDAVKGTAAAHARLGPTLVAEGWLGTPLRLALGLAGGVLVRGAHLGVLPAGAARGIMFYLAFALLFAAVLAAIRAVSHDLSLPARLQPLLTLLRRFSGLLVGRAFVLGASLVDLAFVSLLVFHSGGPLSDAYLLYPLLLLALVPLYSAVPALSIVAGLCGPAYVIVLYLMAGGAFFLGDPLFIRRYLLLFLLSLGSVVMGWLVAHGGLTALGPGSEMSSRALKRTVNDLGRRVQQLRTLQEGVKAINAALALEELLHLIVDNASQVVRDARCSLSLYDEDEGAVVIRAVSGSAEGAADLSRTSPEARAARWVVQNGRSLRLARVSGSPWARGKARSVTSLISVPLIADGRTIGALTASSPSANAFTDEDLESLDAFADQAVIAVNTARFYESVRERRSELEAMLRGIGDAVLATDARLRLTALNPVAAQIFGIRRDVVAGQHLSEIVRNHDLEALFAEILSGDAPSIIREIALPSRTERGARFYQALASPVLGEGSEVRGVVVVLRDITGQKELERAKSDFLSVVSHELKTPLHSIKGFVDIILMGKTGPVSERQQDFLETVREQAMLLQSMINDLLEYSRLEAGETRLRVEPVLLGQIVRGVVERLRPLAEENGLEVTNLVPPDFAPFEADPSRLEQVITNLCFNALKFTSQGGVTISVTDLGAEVQVSVADTGIGIPSEQLESIFGRFYQVDGSATRCYRGAGLGLTICKHIVEYHGGRIWAESAEGQGSTFHFILPKRHPNPEALTVSFSAPARRADVEDS